LNILITGASSGIGACTAKELAAAGNKLILQGRDRERLQAVLSSLDGEGHQMCTGELTEWMNEPKTIPELPPLSGVVWSAGICELSPAMMLSARTLQSTLAVNLQAPLLILSWLYRKKILLDNAKVVLLGSSSAYEAGPGFVAYAASKGGLASAARVLDAEFATRGIRVLCIEPATVLTPMTQKLFDTFKTLESSLKQPPLTPEAVAQQMHRLLISAK
jgi:NAD(P)-dependent dehydrogenase (short-subunit alcohol dehydrogenase family)